MGRLLLWWEGVHASKFFNVTLSQGSVEIVDNSQIDTDYKSV